ncbi:hypothetical protein [Oceanobacter mangrovi]|nr:hypothetical protein [Oceanobacter mangrovi]
MNNAYVVDVEKAIEDAKAARTALLADICSSLVAKTKVSLKKAEKMVAAH